jgi:branched-chain amino acid transport system substrate-binding protein
MKTQQKWKLGRRASLKLGAAFGLALMAGAIAQPAQAAEEYVFGLAMPITGRSALYGKDQVRAAGWAVEAINKAGGINGKKLRMVVLDTQADAQIGIQAATRLATVDKVPVFVTAWSNVVKAVAPVANDNKVLAISIGANSPTIAKLGTYVYTAFPLADVDLTALAKYTYNKLGKRRVAFLYINNESGRIAARVYKRTFESLGGKMAAFESYEPKATDFTGVLLKMRAGNPDMLHIHGLVAEIPQIIAQARQLGMNQRVSSYSAAYNPKLVKQLGKAAEGLIVTSLAPGADVRPAVGAYVKRWKKEAGRPPYGLPYTQYLHDAPYLVAAMFKWIDDKKMKPTGANMRKAMLAVRTFDLPLTGKVSIRDDHTVRKPVYLLTVKGGKFVPLARVE